MDNADTTLRIHPGCLLIFIDETGHETFSNPKFPVFGFGGCAVPGGVAEEWVKRPWREMKAQHFGGADVPLHAGKLRNLSEVQMEAIGEFFRTGRFFRFAVTMAQKTVLTEPYPPIAFMPEMLRRRWQAIARRILPPTKELALLHEASERLDPLVARYFGKTEATVDGVNIPVHQGFVSKGARMEELEVADFIAHTAGCQTFRNAYGNGYPRKDFKAVFPRQSPLTSFFYIKSMTKVEPGVAGRNGEIAGENTWESRGYLIDQ